MSGYKMDGKYIKDSHGSRIGEVDGKYIKDAHGSRVGEIDGNSRGRLKIRTIEDISAFMPTILESHQRMLKAIQEGRPTSWWAMAIKNKEVA